MSWEAVTWASKQRMKLPHEQLILLVLANCADPEGVAFAEWRGREHWWKYLVERTRLSKSSLFRHINTLVDLGLCSRSMIVLADGTRRPTIRLDLTAAFDIANHETTDPLEDGQSHGETGDEYEADTDETINNCNELKQDDASVDRQSHGETAPTSGNDAASPIPTGGTEPFPIVGMQEIPNLVPKILPPTPQAGGSPGPTFEDFQEAWKRSIERLSVARGVWDRIETAKRGEAIAAARGYSAFVAQQRKDYPPLSAQTFLREMAGWSQWLRYVPDGNGRAPSATAGYPTASTEGRAVAVLYDIVGAGDFFRSTMRKADRVFYRLPVTPRLAALAQSPPVAEWATLARNQAAAWETFVGEHLTLQVRQRLREGSRAPWPWPPRKDGTLTASAPSDAGLSDQDIADFK